MYILLEDNKVKEIIPDVDPAFPDIPVEQRYSAEFIENLLYVEDSVEVKQNYEYDPETGKFSEPPETIEPEPEPNPAEPTDTEVLNALLGVTV